MVVAISSPKHNWSTCVKITILHIPHANRITFLPYKHKFHYLKQLYSYIKFSIRLLCSQHKEKKTQMR